MTILKLVIVLAILVLCWRRRKLSPPALFSSIGYAWLIFFVFSSGIAAQYLVWLAPFVLLLSPKFMQPSSPAVLFFSLHFTPLAQAGSHGISPMRAPSLTSSRPIGLFFRALFCWVG